VVAGGFVNSALHPAPEYTLGDDKRIKVYVPPPPKEPKKAKKETKEPKLPALFYSLEPPLVVNFEQSSAVRFLQIGIDLMARDPEVIAALTKYTPIIRNDLLLLISNRDYTKLMTREGKEELRGEALAAVKKILKKETGAAEVEDLLFTSFVVQ
jgi:flagellar FliL protein